MIVYELYAKVKSEYAIGFVLKGRVLGMQGIVAVVVDFFDEVPSEGTLGFDIGDVAVNCFGSGGDSRPERDQSTRNLLR